MAIELFAKTVCIEKIPDRKDVFTLDMKHKFIPGTDFISLYQTGIEGLYTHVDSGFVKLPKKVVLRTDASSDDIENISVKEADIIIANANENDGSLQEKNDQNYEETKE